MTENRSLTVLLHDWSDGDESALEALAPQVYEELLRLARGRLRSERAGHTLQPTALVHEAFAALMEADVTFRDRAHFFAMSARIIRRVLVDHARTRNAQKRGSGRVAVTFDENLLGVGDDAADLLALDETLMRLKEMDARKAELLELQVFAGLTYAEMETTTGLSSSTLDRELRIAKAWVKQQLTEV